MLTFEGAGDIRAATPGGFGWERYVGSTGRVIGMHTFGASAPLKALQQEFGFTVDNVVTTAKALLRPAKAA